MWDSLGVLGLKAGAAVVRRADRLGRPTIGRRVPTAAGYALGGPIVPLDRLSSPRPFLRALAPLPHRVRLGIQTGARRVRAVAARFVPPSRPDDDAVPLRVPVEDRRPPLSTSIVRLAAYLLTVIVVTSVVVYAVGTVAVRTVMNLLG